MSSYLASFTSSSSISNALGSRLNSLRRAITLGDEKDDPENEDGSHISNALRAYYTEKGRPFPSWLPPDPKAPASAAPRPIATASSAQYGQAPAGAYGRGGGLGDLWGDSGASSSGSAQTSSLRRGRGSAASGASGSALTPALSAPPGPVMSPPPQLSHSQSHSPSPGGLHPSGARPLPSQRSGSYQSMQSGRSSQDSRSGASSAQERLRARLHGGRSPSPGNIDPSVRKPVGGRQW
ncbi:MFS sugar transporter [Penicillium brasilianum]|uniref:MFS sugar transporter n=1 Tax=Penicillium brasilianum TaxID=104259 RepID=A0A1S9RXP3_PENBI|nr:MFS sugar transporter [Penicillium brasilianum]